MHVTIFRQANFLRIVFGAPYFGPLFSAVFVQKRDNPASHNTNGTAEHTNMAQPRGAHEIIIFSKRKFY